MSSARRSARGSGAFVTGRRAVGRRLWVLGGLLVVPLLAVFGRLVQWQWIEHAHWAAKAENNTRRLEPTPAHRGEVRWRDGSLAAGERPVFAVQVIAGDVCPPADLYDAVGKQLGVSPEQARLLLRRRAAVARAAARDARRAAWERTCGALVAAVNGQRVERSAAVPKIQAAAPRPSADPTNPFHGGVARPVAPATEVAPVLQAGDLQGRAAELEAEAVHRMGREWARIVGLALRPLGVSKPMTTARAAAAEGDAHHAGWTARAGGAVLLPDPASERLRDLAAVRRRALAGLLERAGAVAVLQRRAVKNTLRDADRVFDRYLRRSLLNRPLELLPEVDGPTILAIEVRPGRPLPGVQVVARGHRVYPGGPVACHVLGYVGRPVERRLPDGSILDEYAEREAAGFWWDALSAILDRSDYERLERIGAFRGEPIGRSGIERARDIWLSGRHGLRISERDAKGRLRESLLDVPAVPGAAVQLTIDPRAQRTAQAVLAATVRRMRAAAIARGLETSEVPSTRGAAAVVMDVHTGELLVCASVPTFDPNQLVPPVSVAVATRLHGPDSPYAKAKPELNRAIQGRYPPGSVLKVVTMVAACHYGVGSAPLYTCEGTWRPNAHGRTLRCMHRHGDGAITLETALTRSCNIIFYKTGYELRRQKMLAVARAFGLGSHTACGLPFESAGRLPGTVNPVQLAIGQGQVVVTPLQVARIYAAVANGGTLVVPRIVMGGEPAAAPVVPQLTPEVCRRVQAGLYGVVHGTVYGRRDHGTAELPLLQRLKAVGKTGSAEKQKERWNVLSFAGYAPYDDPRYAFVVFVERAPHGVYAGEVAAPAAAKILEAVMDPAPKGGE